MSGWRIPAAVRAAALFSAGAGLLALLGWLVNVPVLVRWAPGFIAMVPNTAVGFALAGPSLWLLAGRRSSARSGAARAGAAAVGVLGLASLAEYLFRIDLRIDELLFRDPSRLTGNLPGRMAVATAVSFVAVAAALLVSSQDGPAAASDLLALVPGVLGLMSLSAYAHGLHGFYWVSDSKRMAIATSLTLLVLSLGLLALRSDGGFGRTLRSDTAAGTVARRTFPVALFLPLVIGWFDGVLQRAGLVAPEFQGALISVGSGVVLLTVLWGVAEYLHRLDEERRRAREAVASSERRLEELVNRAPIGIYRASRAGRFVSVNAAFARILGYESPDAVLSLDLARDVYADAADRERVIAAAEGSGGVSSAEVRFKRRDGGPVWVRIYAREIAGPSGGTELFEGFVVDIDERRKAAEALRESEERYRSLIESSRDVITTIGPDGTIRFSSPSTERVTGYKPEDLLGQSAFSYVHPEDAGRVKARLEEILTRETPTVPFSFRFRHRDGTWRTVEAVGSRRAEGPAAGGVVLNSRDTTDIREAEESIWKLQRAVEHSASAIFMTDPDGKITYVNPAFETIYGFSKQEALGRTPRILKSGRYDLAYYQDFWRRLLAGESLHREIVNKTRDGRLIRIVASWSSVRDYDSRLIGFIAVQDDVTEERSLEDQLRQAQKMEAVGQLAGGVAHDFNNLLMAILGYSDLLEKEAGGGSETVTEAIAEIRKAGERAAALTRQLLAFSRRQVLEPTILDLNGLVKNLEKMLRRLISEDVELATKLSPALGRVLADAGQIEQLLLNLTVNARDAMPRGGKLTIETSNVTLDEDYAREHVSVRPGRYVLLAVTDNGEGMSPETQSHIFEPFFTTKGKGKGTGLGLATVYGIVKQSGGYIWVYSEPGHGTTFKIYLPHAQDAEAARPAALTERPARGSETVLLVEDEDAVRKLTHRILEVAGYAVLEAADGAAALRTVQQYEGPIHLLLTDVVMPRMGGSELASRISSLHAETRVLFVSGYTDDTVVRHGLVDGGVAFLQKPYAPDALLRKVREVLDR